MREDEELTTVQVGRSNDHTDKGTVPQYPSKANRAGSVTVTGLANSPVIRHMQSDTLGSRSIQEVQPASQDLEGTELDTDLPVVHFRQGLGPELEFK